jgi:hypothetical protein
MVLPLDIPTTILSRIALAACLAVIADPVLAQTITGTVSAVSQNLT